MYLDAGWCLVSTFNLDFVSLYDLTIERKCFDSVVLFSLFYSQTRYISREHFNRNGSGRLGAVKLILPTISLEIPVPSQGHTGFPSFPVVDWFCLFVDLWVLPFPLEDCSVFGNFVITLNYFSNIFVIPLLFLNLKCRRY